MNIIIDDNDNPLIIKVASIPSARMQVYFLDNEDYFHRKYVFRDKENKFYADNDERTIFFCKGVLETVKKLGWAPDIVHCNDWMTGLIPMYLKTTYKKDPIFKDAKSVFTIYSNEFDFKFDADIVEKAKMLDIDDEMLASLKTADFGGFIRIGMEYADTVVKSDEDFSENIEALFTEYSTKKQIEQVAADDDLLTSYYALYNELAN